MYITTSLLVPSICSIFTFQKLDLSHHQKRLVILAVGVAFGFRLIIFTTIRSSGQGLVIARRIDSENATHIPTSFPRNAEFTEKIFPLIQPVFDRLAHFIFSVFGVMASAGDGVKNPIVFDMFQ